MLVVPFLLTTALASSAEADSTERISLRGLNTESNGNSVGSVISADGRYAVFYSAASNLVSGDTNRSYDVFVRNRMSPSTERVSVTSSGSQSNGSSFSPFAKPSISADNRYVAFQSSASNLVSNDTNNASDAFVHDRSSGMTERVSVATSGSQAAGFSSAPSISADGRYVAFYSDASNLVSGDTNRKEDVFVHDRSNGSTQRVSVSSSGVEANGRSLSLFSGPSISANGQYIAFESTASNLVSSDTNRRSDVFVHDRNSGVTERVSISRSGYQGNSDSCSPSISANGQFIAFQSAADSLVSGDWNSSEDVFIHDRSNGDTRRVSRSTGGVEGNSYSSRPSVSANGQYVTFESAASNLAASDTNAVTDVFVYSVLGKSTERVSVSSSGVEASNNSGDPSINSTGSHVLFSSAASNLVSADRNDATDIFLYRNFLVRGVHAPIETSRDYRPPHF